MEFNEFIFDELVDDRELNRGTALYERAKELVQGGQSVLVSEDDEELFSIVARRFALHHPPLVGR
jgi:hypothetical protein